MDFVFTASADVPFQTWGPQVMEAAGAAPPRPETVGLVQFPFADERTCLSAVRQLLGYLPPNCLEDPPPTQEREADDVAQQALDALTPGYYDMSAVLATLADDVLATSVAYAPNLITAFGRIGGRPVGLIANQPRAMDGGMDGAACQKAERFLRFCDAFRLPVVTLVDTAGVVLDVEQETQGLMNRCCGLLEAYAQATIPKITVLCGRANGSALTLLGCRELGMDAVFAWPQAQLSVLPALTAASILNDREIAAAEDPVAARAVAVSAWQLQQSSPLFAAEQGMLDDIIAPRDTCEVLGATLELLLGKRVRRVRARFTGR
jgi:acetyl-CoA carboxylase carboxyltransferase component